MDIWRANIMDHYRHPRNQGRCDQADFSAVGANLSCGDSFSVGLKLAADTIDEIKFTGYGCAISQAAMSMLSESLKGMTVKEVMALDLRFIEEIFGFKIGSRRESCALLGLETIQKSLKKYQR